jgi:hypothetical protein
VSPGKTGLLASTGGEMSQSFFMVSEGSTAEKTVVSVITNTLKKRFSKF